MTDTIKKQIIFELLLRSKQSMANLTQAVQKSKQAIQSMTRDISATQLKAQKTRSKGWKRRFREQIIGMKEERLAEQRNLDGLQKRLSRVTLAAKKLAKAFDRQGILDMRDAHDSLGGSMSMSLDNMNLMHKNNIKMKTTMGKLGWGVRMMTHGLKGFRMEMLGVMFFGMMLQKTLMGLLKPALEVFGVFDLWRIMLMILFLPVVEALFPWFLKLVTWLMDLDPELQKMIGVFVILGIVLGIVLMVIGQFALGIGSVLQILAPFGVTIKSIIAFFSGLGIAVAVVGAIIAIVVYGIWLAWRENFMNMKGAVRLFKNSVKGAFKSLKKIILGVLHLLTSLWKGDWEGVKDAMKEILDGIVGYFVNFGKLAVSVFAIVGIGVIRVFYGMGKTIKDAFTDIFQWGVDKAFEWAEFTLGAISKVLRALGSWLEGKGLDFLAGKAFDAAKLAESGLTRIQLRGIDQTGQQYPFSYQGTPVSVHITNNISVSDTAEFERWAENNARETAEAMDRLIQPQRTS